MSKTEINDYLSKCDEDLANNVIYRVYGMPGPIFMEKNNDTPTPEPPTPPTPGPDYNIPFYVENITLEEETLTIDSADLSMSEPASYLEIPVEYSTDGTTWSTLGTTGETPLTRTLQPGDKVYLRATTNAWYEYQDEPLIEHTCKIYGVSKVGGNIMSLLYGSNFTGNETTFPNGTNNNFTWLFTSGRENTELISASELILPATILAEGCYSGMFEGCTALTTAPALPATTLAESCYSGMFYGCTALTTAPSLPATTLAERCYQDMFKDCVLLTTVPTILPATTLAEACYSGMFNNCTSLTTAPTLPATTLVEGCYDVMFYGCTNLNRIECLATDISALKSTGGWVDGVAATGTFIKNPNMSDWTTGVNGIPEGWTVEDYS